MSISRLGFINGISLVGQGTAMSSCVIFWCENETHLDMIVAIVVEVEGAEELRVGRDVDVIGVGHPLAQ